MKPAARSAITVLFLALAVSLNSGRACFAQASIPISTLEDLQALDAYEAVQPGGNYILTNDIDASQTSQWNSGKGFKPIGESSILQGEQTYGFIGSFDGQGHVIKNLYINRPDEDSVGLFGNCRGRIVNLKLKNAQVHGREYVGALVGLLWNGSVSNCSSSGKVSGAGCVGGLIGYLFERVYVHDSSSTAEVAGGITVGGLAGITWESFILNCYSIGKVSGQKEAGGLLGFLGDYSGIDHSYSTSPVTGSFYVGGLVGLSTLGCPSVINTSFSTGSVTGSEYVGGLIGENDLTWISESYSSGTVTGTGDYVGGFAGKTSYDLNYAYYSACFWDIAASGQASAGMEIFSDVQGRTTAEMMTKSTYADAGWDFKNVWRIRGKTYPLLKGMKPPQKIHPMARLLAAMQSTPAH